MRFILNFIFYGILFYCIWYFFPDAFAKLITWAGATFDFLKNLVTEISNKFKDTGITHTEPQKAILFLYMWGMNLLNR